MLSDKQEEETYSVIFSSLKHPVRRKILRLLTDGSKTFTEILEQVNVDSSHLSYHLDNLGELLKKENGKYSLSDFGLAATSLMSRVEEPEKKALVFKKSLFQIRPKPLFIFMAAILVISIAASIHLQSLNTQLASTFVETRYRFAAQVSTSLYSLSAMHTSAGWGPPLIFWNFRDEYSNISFADISVRHIFSHSDLGHLSLLELMKLDPDNKKYYQEIDELFLSLLNFTNAMNRLFSENKTSNALAYIERLYDTIRDRPETLAEYFSSAYIYLNKVNEYALERVSEGASALQRAVKSILEEMYKEFPWLAL